MSFKNYLKEKAKTEKPFSPMETINHINRLPQNQKTDMAIQLESVLREEIAKKKRHFKDVVNEDKTDAELKSGLGQWVKDYKVARKTGNTKVAKSLKKQIEDAIKKKGLDSKKVWGKDPDGVNEVAEINERMMLDDEIKAVLRNLDKVMTAVRIDKENPSKKTKKTIQHFEGKLYLDIPYGFNSKDLKRLCDIAKKKYGFDNKGVSLLKKLLAGRASEGDSHIV